MSQSIIRILNFNSSCRDFGMIWYAATNKPAIAISESSVNFEFLPLCYVFSIPYIKQYYHYLWGISKKAKK